MEPVSDRNEYADLGRTVITPYVAWLQSENVPIFYAGGIPWRPYHRALIPASLKPEPVHIGTSEAGALLRKSGVGLIRWFSRTMQEPSSYWYVVCDCYDFEGLSRKVRNQIRKATRECSVESLDTEWVAANAYDCYAAAFDRYKHGRPVSREEFEISQRSCASGPFRYFGAFVNGRLAGLAKCAIEGDYVALVAFKLDPSYSKSLPSYALLHALLQRYVVESRKTLGNGFLSIHDETNMQDFLLKFGFRRVYCDLQITYARALKLAINIGYPFRKIIARLPSRSAFTPMKSLLRQEEVRRSCRARQLPSKVRGVSSWERRGDTPWS